MKTKEQPIWLLYRSNKIHSHYRQTQKSFVLCSSISTADAIEAAVHLKDQLKSHSDIYQLHEDWGENDMVIPHRAAGVLRN